MFSNMVLCVLMLILSYSVTFLSLRYATIRRLVDKPNERTSHVIPTPRGGGIAIALCVFLTTVFLQLSAEKYYMALWALLGGGFLIAALGCVDDHGHVPAPIRFLLQMVAALWMIFCVGGYETTWIANDGIKLGILGVPCAVLATVWLINLYNFMDGIDGYAASEAIFVALMSVFLFWHVGNGVMALLAMVLAVSSAGFLLWNWAPAKIFMGDVGSTLLGFIFACFAMVGSSMNHISPLYWMLALSVFIADATYTLLQRLIYGEPWYKPHRTHAFQRLVQLGYSHKQVCYWMLFFNGFIVFPCILLSTYFPHYLLALVFIIYGFLFFCWRWIGEQANHYLVK